MHLPTIRPMTPDDVEETAAALLGANWGDRRLHLEFATRHPGIVPFVADADGTVVGTGMATINGAVGWIGTIWVHPDWRRRGLGMELTRGRGAGRDPGAPIRAGISIENATGVERLLASGWTALWQAPRLIRGDPLRWQPEAIWGQFNHAMG